MKERERKKERVRVKFGIFYTGYLLFIVKNKKELEIERERERVCEKERDRERKAYGILYNTSKN